MSSHVDTLTELRDPDKTVSAEVTVPAAPERVWEILTSFEEMPRHVTAIQQSRTLEREGNHRVIEQIAGGDLSVVPLSFRVVLDVVEDRPYLYFRQRSGSFTTFSGYWRVDAHPAGTSSRIRYCLRAELGGGLRRWAVQRQLRRMIRGSLRELAAWIEGEEG
jgi:carbon monoxide dehydrogenase subunit G